MCRRQSVDSAACLPGSRGVASLALLRTPTSTARGSPGGRAGLAWLRREGGGKVNARVETRIRGQRADNRGSA